MGSRVVVGLSEEVWLPDVWFIGVALEPPGDLAMMEGRSLLSFESVMSVIELVVSIRFKLILGVNFPLIFEN